MPVCYIGSMTEDFDTTETRRLTGRRVPLDEAVTFLRAHRNQLERPGMIHASVFGSVARGDDGPKSDLDIFVVIDPNRRLSIYDFVGIIHYVQDNLTERADVVELDGMKPRI